MVSAKKIFWQYSNYTIRCFLDLGVYCKAKQEKKYGNISFKAFIYKKNISCIVSVMITFVLFANYIALFS
ncbi:hypothetical protein BpHYR1_016802 [Brachionus plicatilis]|uniref:Uncharacterized protein n=1 Tax=Brachionus plicatilis TaxID=10195 RepID=A0A3M7RLA1_BRAPC|nr:hypothetical protein BpHYR1_016802 [Brachionus plicatilis]